MESAKLRSIQLGQRTKFALGQSSREKLFEEFAKYNDRLRELLRTSDQLTQLKSSRNTKDRSVVKSMSLKWRRAATLYKLLYDAWGCSCQASHRAHLRLQDRSTEDTQFAFDIMFLHSVLSDSTEKPWHHRNTNIVVVKAPAISEQQHCQVSCGTVPSLSQVVSPNISDSRSVGKSKSSFLRKIRSKKATFVDETVVYL